MTTIVYTEEVTTTQSPNSSPRNVQKFTVKIMESSKGGEGRNGQRAGSPKPQKKFSVRHTRKEPKSKSHSFEVQSHFPSGYNPHMFTITAYLPYDGGRRLKVRNLRNSKETINYRPLCLITDRRSSVKVRFVLNT